MYNNIGEQLIEVIKLKKPIVLIVMDGVGIAKPGPGNAYSLAKHPNLDRLFKTYPNTTLEASGEAVGLPEGQMGNSEVGHMNLGAGRIVYQSLTRLNKAMREGEFLTNKAYGKAFDNAKKKNTKLHIFGLLSDGGVHSHIKHIKAMIKAAKEVGVGRTYIHAFMDGRDTDPHAGIDYIKELEALMKEINYGKIATVSGRYYAMDRDKNWDRIKKAYDAITFGKAEHFKTAVEGMEATYAKDVTDEFIIPFVVDDKGVVESNDSVIFMNFRPDRAIEISTAYTNPEFLEGKLDTTNGPKDLTYICTMKYADSVIGDIAYGLNNLNDMLGDYVSEKGLHQLRIAETEKYAHVTFFFDGGVDKKIKGADRVLVHSPKVATYDLQPEMSAYKITEKMLAELDKDIHDICILNFANGDMVGHTGVISAAVKAVETVDDCVNQVVTKILEKGGVALVTADHGNCEKMLTEDGKPFTAHTTNLVPLIITKKGLKLRDGGNLGDVAPTMLKLLGLPQPKAMTGVSIIE